VCVNTDHKQTTFSYESVKCLTLVQIKKER